MPTEVVLLTIRIVCWPLVSPVRLQTTAGPGAAREALRFTLAWKTLSMYTSTLPMSLNRSDRYSTPVPVKVYDASR